MRCARIAAMLHSAATGANASSKMLGRSHKACVEAMPRENKHAA
jgi:hypothetical protein